MYKTTRRTNISGKYVRKAFSFNENDKDQIEVWIDRKPYLSGSGIRPSKRYQPGIKSCKRIDQYIRDNPMKVEIEIYENKELSVWLK